MYSNPPMDYPYLTPSSHQWSIPPTHPTNPSFTTPTTPSFPSFPWELFSPYYTNPYVPTPSPYLYFNHGYTPPPPNPYSSYPTSYYSSYYKNSYQFQNPTNNYSIHGPKFQTYSSNRRGFGKYLQVSNPCLKKKSKKTSQKVLFRNSNSDFHRSQVHNRLEHDAGKQRIKNLSSASNINDLHSSSTSFVSAEPENLQISEAILYTTLTPLALAADESLDFDNHKQYSVFGNEISLDTPQVESVHSTTQDVFSLDVAGEAEDKETLKVYSSMHNSSVHGNTFTHPLVLKSCANLLSIPHGTILHGNILSLSFQADTFVQTALVDMYSKCSVIESARKVFDEMAQRSVVSWNAVILAYCHESLMSKALSLMKGMLVVGFESSSSTFVSILSGYSSDLNYFEFLWKGMSTHCFVVKLGLVCYEVSLDNSMMGMYAQFGQLDEARKVFDFSDEKSIVSWTTIMGGYVKVGCTAEAYKLFNQMQCQNIDIDFVVFLDLISGCIQSRELLLASSVHSLVLKCGWDEGDSIESLLITMYANCGNLTFARRIFDDRKSVMSWTSMIVGYTRSGHLEELDLISGKIIADTDVIRKTWVEIIDFVASASMKFSEPVILAMCRMCAINLFRVFLPNYRVNGAIASDGENDDDDPMFDPAWPHLQLLYELLLKFISSLCLDAKVAEKCIDHSFIRTDSLDPAGRLHAYMQVMPSGQLEKNVTLSAVRSSIRQRRIQKNSIELTSVEELLEEINKTYDPGILEIVKHCTYVGMADDIFALLQHKTHLYLANVVNLSKESMYQQVLSRFGHFNAIQLSDPAPVKDLIILALKDSESNDDDTFKEKIAEMNTDLLKQKAAMLEEYFGINIDDDHGNISRLHVILDQVYSCVLKLSILDLGDIIRLSNEIRELF